MLNVGVVGVTGYAGEELVELLLGHPQVRIAGVYSRSAAGKLISDVFPRLKGRIELECGAPDPKAIARACDLLFLALPHTVSMQSVPQLIKLGKRIVDLSADYRLKDARVYKEYYNTLQSDPVNLKSAVYGLPELYRLKIKSAGLVANPGCYPTAAILSLAPLFALGLAEPDSVIIDAKSGVTGAGRKLAEGFLFSEIDEDFRAYKVGCHQHAPEIDQALSGLSGKKMRVTFVPHLLPLNRGILETIYVKRAKGQKQKYGSLSDVYKKFYKNEPFVRIKKTGEFPRIKDVAGTNFCDIGIQEDLGRVIIISAIDNLLKGASGQAVQNMNIMCGFSERTALC